MLKKIKNNKIKHLKILFAFALVSACGKQAKINDNDTLEIAKINVDEQCEYHIFKFDSNFNISDADVAKIEALLKNARADNIENIEFLIVSNSPISIEKQTKIKWRIKTLMYKNEFIRSRIIDRGICVYKYAKPGVRIGILRYKVKEPDCSIWDEYIGDIDTRKNLPRYGVSNAYNLKEMIANTADLTSPRKYPGARVSSAINAMKTKVSGESKGSASGSSHGSNSNASNINGLAAAIASGS